MIRPSSTPRLARFRCARRDEGGVLVMVTVWLTALLLFAGFVIDVGQWFVHRRHLQLQADAAALAGGHAFSLASCSNTAIEDAARQYAGPQAAHTQGTYNAQVGGTPSSNIHVLINSGDNQYWRTASDDGTPPNFSTGNPCSNYTVDVKVTEQGSSRWLSSFVPSIFPSFIDVHARVQILQADTMNGTLPIAVRDVNPKSAAVIFYNEGDPSAPSVTPLNVRYLTKSSSSGGLTYWDDLSTDPTMPSQTGPAQVAVAQKTGAVIALSTKGPPQSSPMSLTGTVAQICGQSQVDCFYADANGNIQSGLLYIQGFTPRPAGYAPTATDPPVLRSVTLDNGTCGDGGYSYFFYATANCSVRLNVQADLGRAQGQLQLTAFGGQCGNNGCNVNFSSGTTPTTAASGPALWRGTIPVAAAAGPIPITLSWVVKNGSLTGYGTCDNNFSSNNPCHDSFGTVQRTFSGSDDLSGPIRTAHLLNMDSGAAIYGGPWNSYGIGTSHSLAVSIALGGAVATAKTDPPVALRVTGSQNGSIDCDPNKPTLREEIATGCGPAYQINTDANLACPATATALWQPQPPPWTCVATQTGGAVGQFTQGIQDRVLGGATTCPAAQGTTFVPGRDYWQNFPNFDPTDPRIVDVFMVPFGSFRGSGNAIFPVVDFGEFYITGWGGNGNGNDDPCPQLDGSSADSAPAGFLIGHFVKRLDELGSSTGTQPCDPSSPTPCIVRLTQ